MRTAFISAILAVFPWCGAAAVADVDELVPATLDDRPGARVVADDPEAARIIRGVQGHFRSVTGASGNPNLEYRGIPVSIEGFSNATYFEVARQDSTWAPFRQGVIHVFRRKGDLIVRIFDIGASAGPGAGLRDALANLWPAGESFPKLNAQWLQPNMDLVAKVGGGLEKDLTAATTGPVPCMRAGAVEMTGMLGLWNHDSLLIFADRGFDADGKQVWGPAPKDDYRFARVEGANPASAVRKLDAGLISIDVTPGEGPPLETGGSVVVNYSFWLTDGTLVDTSRRTGREPLRQQIPGTPIKGFDAGLIGITKGERRRLIVPPELGFGKSGARSNIPPDSTLIFEVECLWLQNPLPPPAPVALPDAPAAPPVPNPAPPK